MKAFQKIVAIALVFTIFNIVLGKAIHEFSEHNHKQELHDCDLAGTNHFHELELMHIDLLCNFNLSATVFNDILSDFNEIIRYQEDKVKIHFLWLVKDLSFSSISLRGPPTYI